MRRLGYAAIGLVVLAIAEVLVFVGVAKTIGLLWAVLLAVAVFAAGCYVMRREGVRGWRRFRAAYGQGRSPGEEVTDGLVGMVAALLLMVPGFLTDAVGLLLLAPPVRRVTVRRVRGFAERRISPGMVGDIFGPRRVRASRGAPVPPQPAGGGANAGGGSGGVGGDVVEGEIVDPRP